MQNQTARFEALESMVGNLEKQAKKLGMFSGLVSKVSTTEEHVQAIASCQEDIQQDVASLLVSSTAPVKLLQTLSSQIEQDIGQIHSTQNALFAQHQSVFTDSFDELLKVHHTLIDGLRDDISQLSDLISQNPNETDQNPAHFEAAITSLQERIDALSQHLETLQTENVGALENLLENQMQNMGILQKSLDHLQSQNVGVLEQVQQTMDVLQQNAGVLEQLEQNVGVLEKLESLESQQSELYQQHISAQDERFEHLLTQQKQIDQQLEKSTTALEETQKVHGEQLDAIKTLLTQEQISASADSHLESMIAQLGEAQEQHSTTTLTILEQQLQSQQKEINSKLVALEVAISAQEEHTKNQDSHTSAITEQLASLHSAIAAIAEQGESDNRQQEITDKLVALEEVITAQSETLTQAQTKTEDQQQQISDKLSSLEAATSAQAQTQGVGQLQENQNRDILEKLIALEVSLSHQREEQLQTALQKSSSQEVNEQMALLKSTVTTQGQALTQILEIMQENQHAQLISLTETLEKLDTKTTGLETFNQELQGDRRKFLAMADAIDNLSSLRESARHTWCAMGLIAIVTLVGYFV